MPKKKNIKKEKKTETVSQSIDDDMSIMSGDYESESISDSDISNMAIVNIVDDTSADQSNGELQFTDLDALQENELFIPTAKAI